MCCIFTCCGWLIDLVQRLWTFTMSCCISSAVCCVMLTSSMSGIAMGYNYSLAEYIDLKETNVSVYLKRGVFDDEIADDMDWRRSGRMPVAGHLRSDNLLTGAPDDDGSTTLRSGRRLDDSVFEADDHHRYEGSLMKLTAKPPYEDTTAARVTEDHEMQEINSRYTQNVQDHMKAIQSLLDSRRAMAATAGSTLSPLPTYAEPKFPMYINPGARRMPPPEKISQMSAARKAVPEGNINNFINWIGPMRPNVVNKDALPDYGPRSPTLTYPSPITLPPTAIRVKISTTNIPDGVVIFPSRSLAPGEGYTLGNVAFEPKEHTEANQFNDKILAENDFRSKQEFKKAKMGSKTSEEEYEDEIKGLPVRKRRSVKVSALDNNANATTENNFTDIYAHNTDKLSFPSDISDSHKIKKVSEWTKEITFNPTFYNQIYSQVQNNLTDTKNQSFNNYLSNNFILSARNIVNKELKSVPENKIEINSKPLTENKRGYSLLHRLITITEAKNTRTEATTQKAQPVKKVRIRRNSFESKIVSSKYSTGTKPTRALETKQTTIGVAELLQSVSINLNEAGLLRDPSSSTLIKLLQSTLT